jgi:putative transposase
MAPALPRRHRRNYNEPGHAHELTFSCYQRFPFLGRDRTCQWLRDSLEEARRTLDFDLWAWVFMPDHVHLIVHPRQPVYDIALIRRRIKEPVAQQAIAWIRHHAPEWLSRMERRRGNRVEHLFWQSGGGYDRNITEAKTLLTMIDYLHNNPVRQGLVVPAEEWTWSSAAWFVDQRAVPLIPDRIPPERLDERRLGP